MQEKGVKTQIRLFKGVVYSGCTIFAILQKPFEHNEVIKPNLFKINVKKIAFGNKEHTTG